MLVVNEKMVKKRLDFCLGVEGWSTGFEVAECETEWCDHDVLMYKLLFP